MQLDTCERNGGSFPPVWGVLSDPASRASRAIVTRFGPFDVTVHVKATMLTEPYLETGSRGELWRDTGGFLREIRRGTRELWRDTGGSSTGGTRVFVIPVESKHQSPVS